MFFRGKKSANTIFKLCYEYSSIALYPINPLVEPCINPAKTLDKGQIISWFLGAFCKPYNKSVGFPVISYKKLCSLPGKDVKIKDGMKALKERSHFEKPEVRFGKKRGEGFIRYVERIVSILEKFESLSPEARSALEESGVRVTHELVQEVLLRFRNDWKPAFTCFLWAGSQEGYKHKLSEYHLMISILGRLKRFKIAWGVIREMQSKGRDGGSLVKLQTLLIMMRCYSSVHDAGRAIRTFYALGEFNLKVDVRAFQELLDALCRYRNVRVAEGLLDDKKDVFGYRRSYNIVLNGWCNVIVDLVEAKRFWKVMADEGIKPDADSYNSMICCFSKTGRLHDVLRLFDEMKRRNCAPDLKVYNSMVYSLVRGNCVEEAFNLLNAMPGKGFAPNAETYNSIVISLCKGHRLKEAAIAFDAMIQKGHSPSIRIFHAYLVAMDDPNATLMLFKKMITGNCAPMLETFIILIRKFCRWGKFETVLKLWNDMVKRGLGPDQSAYVVLIHGLFLNGKREEAHKYLEEMKAKGFAPEANIDEMINTWIASRASAASQLKDKKTQDNTEERKIENISKNDMPWWKRDREFNWT